MKIYKMTCYNLFLLNRKAEHAGFVMKKSNALTIEVRTHNVTGRGDQVACSCFHAETDCSHWFGVLLAFSPLWSQQLVS